MDVSSTILLNSEENSTQDMSEAFNALCQELQLPTAVQGFDVCDDWPIGKSQYHNEGPSGNCGCNNLSGVDSKFNAVLAELSKVSLQVQELIKTISTFPLPKKTQVEEGNYKNAIDNENNDMTPTAVQQNIPTLDAPAENSPPVENKNKRKRYTRRKREPTEKVQKEGKKATVVASMTTMGEENERSGALSCFCCNCCSSKNNVRPCA
jgi:hypothetical protein